MQQIQKTENNSRMLLVVQDHSGHSENEIKWNPKDEKQVEGIREMFMTLKEQGFMFFKVKKRLGFLKTKGEHVSEFNPDLKQLIVEKNMDWTPVEEKEVIDDTEIGEEEVEEVVSHEEAEWFDPEEEEIEEEVKYVATQPIKGG